MWKINKKYCKNFSIKIGQVHDLHRTLGSNDSINRWFCKWIKTTISPPHEVWLQQVPTVTIVFKFPLIQLHGQVRCLEVQWHHLAASIPEHLKSNAKLNGSIDKAISREIKFKLSKLPKKFSWHICFKIFPIPEQIYEYSLTIKKHNHGNTKEF